MLERELAEIVVVTVLIGVASACTLVGIFVWAVILPSINAVWVAFAEGES